MGFYSLRSFLDMGRNHCYPDKLSNLDQFLLVSVLLLLDIVP